MTWVTNGQMRVYGYCRGISGGWVEGMWRQDRRDLLGKSPTDDDGTTELERGVKRPAVALARFQGEME